MEKHEIDLEIEEDFGEEDNSDIIAAWVFLIWLAGSVITFGHAHTYHPQAFGVDNIIRSLFWPWYWSGEAWERVSGDK